MRYAMLGRLAALALVAASCGSAAPTEGPVTIETDLEFSTMTQTFEVTQGSDLLGCSGGTVMDSIPDGFEQGAVATKTLTCDTGDKSGTFTMSFTVVDSNGTWDVETATAGFAGLQGSGDISVVVDDDLSGLAETLTGEIEFAP